MRLGIFLACFDWQFLYSIPGPDAKLSYVEEVLFTAQDSFCPLESYKVRMNGSYRVSAKLAHLSHAKSKEFKKHGYSPQFKVLQKKVKTKIKAI